MYFAIDIYDGQSCPYMLEEVGHLFDYYIVWVDDIAALRMNLAKYDPIPLTEEEAKAFWFVGIRSGFVKIHPHDWEKFGRELLPEYEISKRGKILYPITSEDEKNAVSLMKKVLKKKIKIWIDNSKIFGYNDYLAEKILKDLNFVNSLIEAINIYFTMQKYLYKEDVGENVL